jgi:hypothetical protein
MKRNLITALGIGSIALTLLTGMGGGGDAGGIRDFQSEDARTPAAPKVPRSSASTKAATIPAAKTKPTAKSQR